MIQEEKTGTKKFSQIRKGNSMAGKKRKRNSVRNEVLEEELWDGDGYDDMEIRRLIRVEEARDRLWKLGSERILKALNADLDALTSAPEGTHIGQLPGSQMKRWLPSRFLMSYDYELIWMLRAMLLSLRKQLSTCRRPADMLVVRMCFNAGRDVQKGKFERDPAEDLAYWLKGISPHIYINPDLERLYDDSAWIREESSFHIRNWTRLFEDKPVLAADLIDQLAINSTSNSPAYGNLNTYDADIDPEDLPF